MAKFEVELSIKVKAEVHADNKEDIINHVYDLDRVCALADEFKVSVENAKEVKDE